MSSDARVLKTVFRHGGSWAEKYSSEEEVSREPIFANRPSHWPFEDCSPATLWLRAASKAFSLLIASSQGLGAPGKQTTMQVMLSKLPWIR